LTNRIALGESDAKRLEQGTFKPILEKVKPLFEQSQESN